MDNFNRVVLLGRAVKKLHLVKGDGYISGRFVLAVNRKKKASEQLQQTDFVPVVVWGNYAEKIASYIDKGRLLLVEGAIHVNEVDDSDKNRSWFTQISADKVLFIGSTMNQDKSKKSHAAV